MTSNSFPEFEENVWVGSLHEETTLRTAVPLVSYIKNSLRFWYYASLSTCCQNLEKKWGHRENLGESGGQTFKGI